MTKYAIRAMTAQDILTVRGISLEAPLWEHAHDLHLQILLTGEAWTGTADGEIIACGGVIPVWPGLAEVWIAVSPLAKEHVSFLFRQSKRFLDLITDHYSLRRLQTNVQADLPEAVRFVEHLGFVREATLSDYGPNGETFYSYKRVKSWQ